MNKTKQKTTESVAYKGVIPRNPFRFLFYVSRPHKWWATSAILVVIFNSIASVFLIVLLKQVITAAETGDTQTVVFWGLMYPVFIFLSHGVWRISGFLGRKWIIEIRKDTADILASYTFSHSHSYFSDRFAGSLLSKMGNVVGAMERFAVDMLWQHLEGLVKIVTSAVVILSIHVATGSIFIGLIVALVILNYFLIPRKRIFSRESAEANTLLRGRLVDVFSNISATRQYGRQASESLALDAYTTNSREKHSISWLYSEYIMFVNGLVLFAFSVFMFQELTDSWIEGVIPTGDFIVIMVLVFNLAHTLIMIGRTFNDTATAYGESEEGLDELLLPHEITDKPDAEKLKIDGGEIEWKKVVFKFEGNRVFSNFDLTIKPGQRVGLVGPSGAGKTTFVSLLLRQHEIGDGSIEIDGQNIAEVTQASLRQNIAVVPQEPLLFHRSILENIVYGNPKATKKDIETVAKKAQAHRFIMDLPEGYNTLVGERGIKLSGGQKQRVAIARAMLKDAPILVLDEATSALDSESEVLIQKALEKLMEGKTVIAVAHRLSTLRKMDRILVLEKGKIQEDGTHDELTQSGGTYQRLWEHQAGGFITD